MVKDSDVLASGGCRIGSHGNSICMVLELKEILVVVIE